MGRLCKNMEENNLKLPKIKPGVLSPVSYLKNIDLETAKKLNIIYAKDYKVKNDLSIISKSLRKLSSQ